MLSLPMGYSVPVTVRYIYHRCWCLAVLKVHIDIEDRRLDACGARRRYRTLRYGKLSSRAKLERLGYKGYNGTSGTGVFARRSMKSCSNNRIMQAPACTSNPHEVMVKCVMHNCGRGYEATMMVLETGIVWGADVVMLQEPYVEREGYNISHPGYRLIRGGRTMTAIRRDMHLEFSEVDKGGDGDVQVFDIRYPSGRKMRLVNVYDQLRQEGGVRSQGRPAQTARWREIMEQDKILLGGDWNAHSDRWDPQCPPKRDANFLENLVDEYDLIDVTDGEETHSNTRNGKTSGSLIDFFITKASMADRLETSMDLTTTSDHAIVCAQ